MDFFTDLDARVAALRDRLGEVVNAEDLTAVVSSLEDDAVCELAEIAAQAARMVQQVALSANGVIATRSTRDAGHSGLAQARGHRNAVAFVQHVSGVSRREAVRQVRVGEALVEAEEIERQVLNAPDNSEVTPTEAPVIIRPWHAPLGSALRNGSLSTAQHDAIRMGLGEPPVATEGPGLGFSETTEAEQGEMEAVREAWSLAAERLIEFSDDLTVEELGKQARAVRDALDPEGAEARFQARFEARSFKMWTDAQGLTHGKFVFDDESAARIRSLIDSALRPRRGGPRFVDPAAQAAAKELSNDPRTNEQLAHDLLIDVLGAGVMADAEAVFGARQPGVRLVQIVDREAYLAEQQAKLAAEQALKANGAFASEPEIPTAQSTVYLEDGLEAIPASFAAKQRCASGVRPVIADRSGNPLDVGREQRLYTAKQRVALAVRDGGCRWPSCDRPASYCEAHHIDEWVADTGRTDIDRGILLCRFHHLQLHNNGWRITRDNLGEFLLHSPEEVAARSSIQNEGTSVSGTDPGGHRRSGEEDSPTTERTGLELRPPLPLSYAWQMASPPDGVSADEVRSPVAAARAGTWRSRTPQSAAALASDESGPTLVEPALLRRKQVEPAQPTLV